MITRFGARRVARTGAFLAGLAAAGRVLAAAPQPPAAPPAAAAPVAQSVLGPAPEPQRVPAPGPAGERVYAPQAILPGGILVPLFQAASPHLRPDRLKEAEVYAMTRGVPGRIASIVNIHNPSIEVHRVPAGLNTGAAVIVVAGGGHNTLNVGSEGADFVPFFYNYGINTIILRNRLRRDGYDVQKDAVADLIQAIKVVRAYAADWAIDPARIGAMGFSAGAELTSAAAVGYAAFDKAEDAAGNPLAKISSRPDFVGLIYPGPTPFRGGANVAVPGDAPASFIASGGVGDAVHAVWADEYFAAFLRARIPNLEMHIYGNGRHPGDPLPEGGTMSGGLTDRGAIPFGTWQLRFIDWFRDLGFLQKPGVETKAARDAAIRAANAPMPAASGEWVSLFDGRTLTGWQTSEHPESWTVAEGALVTGGERSHLFYVGPVANHAFRNFELSAEVMTTPGSNSGIYVHTQMQGPGFPAAGYELQVINSNRPVTGNAYVEHKMTGSIYAVRNTWRSPAFDNQWFTYRVRVVGKTIQTFINDAPVCEYIEPAGAWRPDDKKGRLLGSGTIALQAHDPGSVVRFRAIRVRVLPDDLAAPGAALDDRELDELITSLSNDNVPLIDIGLVPAAGAGVALAAEARRYGLTIASALPPDAVSRLGASLVVVNDRERAPDVAQLQAAKASGAKIAFSSGGAATIDPARLKRRLLAIRAAGLSARDLWIPWKD